MERILLRSGSAPESTAMECGTRAVTYGELADRIGKRKSELARLTTVTGFVSVERGRSFEFVVDFLAVLALDAVPVPIDPALPERRRDDLRSLIGPGLVLTETGYRTRLAGTPPIPADGAYVFFTSGSTGVPKPVLGSADALASFLDWQCAEFGIGPGDRGAFLTALSFDVAVRDMFLPLWAGATLVIPEPEEATAPEATVAWLRRSEISVVNVVPSVARSWLRHGRTRADALRTVFFAGEPLDAALLEGWPAAFPGTLTRVNFYGTTETTLPKVYRRLDEAERAGGSLPVGRPVPGTRYCLVDPERPFDAALVRAALADPADRGEIVLVGRHLSHGYVSMPAETAARFAELDDGERAYRTGDLGRVDEHGELTVAGRTDDELKINGVRIHPAEIAMAIRASPGVADAFVTGDGGRLAGYVVPAPGHDLDPAGLRRRLMSALPPAMMPARLVELTALPTLPNGKIDRTALHRLGQNTPEPARDFVEPSGEVERQLAEWWAGLFGTRRISADQDFMALGGDSITAMQLISRIRRDLGVTLTVRTIFARSTITEIAREIVHRQLLSLDPDEIQALLDVGERDYA